MDGGSRLRALDGLRGIAVLMVIADHAGIAGRDSLGSAGVTIFFVLSGYLISRVVIDARHRGTWSMRTFLLDRAVRLVPALLVMVAVVVAGWLALGGPTRGLGLEVAAALTYTMNLAFMQFDGGLLRHTWSLAVEEQFYLVWPLVMPLVVKLRRPLVWLGVAIAASMLARLGVAAAAGAYAAYPTLPTNAFALLLGCCLAVRPISITPGRGQRTVPLVGLAAIVVIALTAAQSPVAFLWVPIPVSLIAAVVVTYSVPGVPVLEASWLRFAGRISYSLYLWHWPMLKLFAIPALALAVTLFMAVESTLLVEEPLRRRWRAARARRRAVDVLVRA